MEEKWPEFDLSTREGAKACEEYVNKVLRDVLKAHPKYPEYGYVYEDGKLIEKKLDCTSK